MNCSTDDKSDTNSHLCIMKVALVRIFSRSPDQTTYFADLTENATIDVSFYPVSGWKRA